jgi:hypothetical protein
MSLEEARQAVLANTLEMPKSPLVWGYRCTIPLAILDRDLSYIKDSAARDLIASAVRVYNLFLEGEEV